MSQTKVKVPDLSPSEYGVLIEALKVYHETQKEVAISKDVSTVTFKQKSDARGNAAMAQLLIEKIG